MKNAHFYVPKKRTPLFFANGDNEKIKLKKIASRKKKEKQEKSKTSIQFNFLF